MPQSRRKIPFSGKAKKEQLKTKKQRNQQVLLRDDSNNEACGTSSNSIQKLNYQSNKATGLKGNRYALQFFREDEYQIQKNKEAARKSLQPKEDSYLEINGDDYFIKELEFPKRPSWSFDFNKDQLDAKENKYFTEYLKEMEKLFAVSKDISYFELNLETWRQLWRVLEMSDIILFIVDIRYPALMFPPSLYDYVTATLKKDFILVLNKIDLAPAPLVVAWKHYFQQKYPQLHIVMFTTLPGYNLIGNRSDKAGLNVRRKKGRQRMAAEGTQELFNVCEELSKSHVDLSDWKIKIQQEIDSDEHDDNDKIEIEESITLKNTETNYFQYEKYRNKILTIGCIGQPNVGKSSLLNAIMGKKVVSVSKTPGHTKHFQTIFITPNVRLCDCPGLVFPSKVPKAMQVLMGSFPIAQLREPFSSIQFLAERLDLIRLLRIDHPSNDTEWSAMDVCDGWAKKRGFITAKAARLDSYRAANSLLRMALDGKICVCLTPPKYFVNKTLWENHADVEKVRWIQASDQQNGENEFATIPPQSSSSGSDEEDGKESGSSETETLSSTTVNKFALLQSDD